MKRGEVVLVQVPFVGLIGGKVRPALILQNDKLNHALQETIIAEITSNLSYSQQPHQFFIDISTPDGRASGLLMNSAVRCERLHTIPQTDVKRVIGSLSQNMLNDIEKCLKASLKLS